MPALLAPLLDAVIVIVFASVGRRNHGEEDAISGVFHTAWPFLVGALVGWLIVLLTRRTIVAGQTLTSGIVVWLSTVAIGMVLRHLTDRGVALSFVIVSLCFNGALMLGWRALAHLFGKRARARS